MARAENQQDMRLWSVFVDNLTETKSGMRQLTFLLLMLNVPIGFAADVEIPRCWTTDQAHAVQDGLFRVFISTNGTEAMQVALTIGLLSQSLRRRKA